MTENINLPKVLFLYNQDGKPAINVQAGENTLWLSQKQIAELFETNVPNINEHIKNIYSSGELAENTTIRDFRIVVNRGFRGEVEEPILHYNLDMIIAVGYRVNSKKATQFRIWATKVLHEYIQKGFALDDERFKQGNKFDKQYFKELRERIKDIRTSEKVFWRQILDIYATSIDYNPKSEISIDFFKEVQNKMHWASHGHTAAEIIMQRADSEKDFMGLTNFQGDVPTLQEAVIAKNYLTDKELDILNRIVTMYLDYAELQALNEKTMTMREWVNELDYFIKMNRKDVLQTKGTVSHKEALEKARNEYKKYKERINLNPTEVELHYIESTNKLKKLAEKN